MNSLIYFKNIFLNLLDAYADFEIRTYYLGFILNFKYHISKNNMEAMWISAYLTALQYNLYNSCQRLFC